MTQKLISGRWIAGGLTVAVIAAVALTSFSGNGMQVEAAGIEMTLKASMNSGLHLMFAAA